MSIYSYDQLKTLTPNERYKIASDSYHQLVAAQPELRSQSGQLAAAIVNSTGLDFDTAVVVALSAPID